jgi:phosphohistidine phosphatase SixA
MCDPLSMRVGRHVFSCLALLGVLAPPAMGQAPSTDPVDLARARDPGIVTLIRHARAPGAGDPAVFTLADCATQRNLSEQGRQDARALGVALRAVGVREADVRTSQWCRCVETARLLGVGRVQTATYLNSFYAARDEQSASTQALRAAVLQKLDSRRPTVLVTHQVNISALTGVTPAEGEVVFVRATAAGSIDVVGRVRLP